MASRLYPSSFPLYLAVEQAFARLALARSAIPTWAALITLVVTGLPLFDVRPTQARVAHVLPTHDHDALNRLLRTMPFFTYAVVALYMACFTTSAGAATRSWTM